MVRPIAFLAGLGFVFVLLFSLVTGAVAYISEPPAKTAEHEFHLHPKEVSFASDGPLGKFDRQQLQRGFQVYKEVCSACHSLHQVAFRDLKDLGFTDAEVKAIAKNWATEVPSINPETGEPATRKGTPADKIPAPYANEVAARAANNNALPPDLSLMAKARHDGGAYIYSLLTGYQDQPAELLKHFPDAKTPASLHYNPYFANLNLAMPPPLAADGQVTYADGTKSTVDQMAKDVSAFLIWTAEPKLEKRHATGIAVLGFLLIATILAYLSYRNIWAGIKH
ncbi:cytochrome c1 [Sphingomonas histidinilytica]|jgi:ubiquinol-cytochrome c reductase cytochrome c1 subunit|uniref:Cytochrome c1 n=1 Tax=Rhizorhabdus histidinilytica TaxID=439228 RepID=A0A1T5C3C7_9SPHN|nr:cytochrome c1 [Rhizorhabdus histidinilytica]MBO9375352.1 cytochrome c1 [Rhizorhabdus histidinilytica]QEH77280.1 cytochrome c1 [Sphingomonas sp. C8-2]SKB53843.1 ubiquinol-cytochrome c reductase cytochrome c1 subunit [Rhizorhabdus histidinilytica]